MSCNTIYEKRGTFRFRDETGKLKKFNTLEDAIEAGGVEEDSTPQVNVSGVPYKVDSSDVKVETDEE